MELKDFSIILGHVILSKVITLKIKIFGEIEVYDGLYNYLLCVIKVHKISKSTHIQKDVFHDQYSIEMF
jgi:hypothetical protein